MAGSSRPRPPGARPCRGGPAPVPLRWTVARLSRANGGRVPLSIPMTSPLPTRKQYWEERPTRVRDVALQTPDFGALLHSAHGFLRGSDTPPLDRTLRMHTREYAYVRPLRLDDHGLIWLGHRNRRRRCARSRTGVKRGEPQVFRLFGYAGTGKTTLAKQLAADSAGRRRLRGRSPARPRSCCGPRAARTRAPSIR